MEKIILYRNCNCVSKLVNQTFFGINGVKLALNVFYLLGEDNV